MTLVSGDAKLQIRRLRQIVGPLGRTASGVPGFAQARRKRKASRSPSATYPKRTSANQDARSTTRSPNPSCSSIRRFPIRFSNVRVRVRERSLSAATRGPTPMRSRSASRASRSTVRFPASGKRCHWSRRRAVSRPSCRLTAGGWYTIEVRAIQDGAVFAATEVEPFGVGEVFVGAGQSNSTNFGEVRTQPKSGMVSSFSGEEWQLADDPQPGVADKTQGGSFWPAFGDAMYDRFGVPIGIASTGYGGTSVNQWQPSGDLFPWMMTARPTIGAIWIPGAVVAPRRERRRNAVGTNTTRS